MRVCAMNVNHGRHCLAPQIERWLRNHTAIRNRYTDYFDIDKMPHAH